MIEIKHTRGEVTDRLVTRLKQRKFETRVDSDAIDSEVVRITEKPPRVAGEAAERRHEQNAKALCDYLCEIEAVYQKLKNKQGLIRIEYNAVDSLVVSRPISLRKVDMFSFETTDVLDMSGYKMIRVDYTHLVKCMLFSLAHKDLGYPHDYMEEFLCGKSSMAYSTDISLFDRVLEEVSFNKIRKTAVGDSLYHRVHGGVIVGYYGDKIAAKTYDAVAVHDGNKTMQRILNEVLERFIDRCKDLSLAGLYNRGFTLICKEESTKKEVLEVLSEGVCVELFGRKFEAHPLITCIDAKG